MLFFYIIGDNNARMAIPVFSEGRDARINCIAVFFYRTKMPISPCISR